MNYTTLLYPLGYILLIVLVAAAALLIGKQKYKKAHPAEKKAKTTPSEPENRNLSAGTPVTADETRDKTAETDPAEVPNSTQEVIEGPFIIVDEEKVAEWRPPSEKRIGELAEEQEQSEKQESCQNAQAAEQAAANDEWTDDDLEIFEARAYAFSADEETPAEAASEPADDKDTDYLFFTREHETVHDPAEDEGVEVLEVKDLPQKENTVPAEPKHANSKYAYFDSVMDKEKSENEKTGQCQADDAVIYGTKPEDKSKKNPSMQYIELDLENTDD